MNIDQCAVFPKCSSYQTKVARSEVVKIIALSDAASINYWRNKRVSVVIKWWCRCPVSGCSGCTKNPYDWECCSRGNDLETLYFIGTMRGDAWYLRAFNATYSNSQAYQMNHSLDGSLPTCCPVNTLVLSLCHFCFQGMICCQVATVELNDYIKNVDEVHNGPGFRAHDCAVSSGSNAKNHLWWELSSW